MNTCYKRKTLIEEEANAEDEVILKVLQERRKQDEKWSIDWSISDLYFNAILMEEVGEVSRAIQEKDMEALMSELVQVAAVCVRWLTALTINRNTWLRNRVRQYK